MSAKGQKLPSAGTPVYGRFGPKAVVADALPELRPAAASGR